MEEETIEILSRYLDNDLDNDEAARLEDYLQAIRLRKWLVLALTLLGLLGAFLFATSRQPTYTAETTVLLRGSPSESRIPGQDAAPNLEREREILASLAQGNSYKLVANDLNISIDTVRFHIRNIYRKLHVHTQSEAVAKAVRRGWA